MTDEQCLKAVVDENCCTAFAALMQRYYRQVYVICLRRLRNTADAEDATQEVFRKLLERPDTINRDLRGWLSRCAANTSVSMIRSDSARRRREAEATTHTVDPDQTAEALDRSEIVSRMLRELDPHQRDLLIRHVVQGESQSALAEELGVTQQAVASRITTIRRRLRAWLVERRLVSVGLGWLVTGWWAPVKAAALRIAGILGMTTTGGGVGVITGASAGKGAVATAMTVGLICLLPGDDPAAFSPRPFQPRTDEQVVSTSTSFEGPSDTQYPRSASFGRSATPNRFKNNAYNSGRSINDMLAANRTYAAYTQVTSDPLQYDSADRGVWRLTEVNNPAPKPVAWRTEPPPPLIVSDIQVPQSKVQTFTQTPRVVLRNETRASFRDETPTEPVQQTVMPGAGPDATAVYQWRHRRGPGSLRTSPGAGHDRQPSGSWPWMPDTLASRPDGFRGFNHGYEAGRDRSVDFSSKLKKAYGLKFKAGSPGFSAALEVLKSQMSADIDVSGLDPRRQVLSHLRTSPRQPFFPLAWFADRDRLTDNTLQASISPDVPVVFKRILRLTKDPDTGSTPDSSDYFTRIANVEREVVAIAMREQNLPRITYYAAASQSDQVVNIPGWLGVAFDPSLQLSAADLPIEEVILFDGRITQAASTIGRERLAANFAHSVTVPEPTGLTLMGLGAFLLTRRPRSSQ